MKERLQRWTFSCVAAYLYSVQGQETLGTFDINKKITSKKYLICIIDFPSRATFKENQTKEDKHILNKSLKVNKVDV